MIQTVKRATRTMTCTKCLQPIRTGSDYIETDTGIKTHLFCKLPVAYTLKDSHCVPTSTQSRPN